MTSDCCVMQEISKMAARTAVGATIRAVSKPRKFAARKAAITLVSLSLSLEWIKKICWFKHHRTKKFLC